MSIGISIFPATLSSWNHTPQPSQKKQVDETKPIILKPVLGWCTANPHKEGTPSSKALPIGTRWAPNSWKWTYYPHRWPCKWVTVVITRTSGVISPCLHLVTGPILYVNSDTVNSCGKKQLTNLWINCYGWLSYSPRNKGLVAGQLLRETNRFS